MLPALAGLALTVCAATAALALAGRLYGVLAPVSVLLIVAVAAVPLVRRARRGARRRAGHYTPDELADLNTPELVTAVGHLLRRDGWRPLPPSAHDTFHVTARDRRGRLLDAAFRPVAEPLPDEDGTCACLRRTRTTPTLHLVIHRGTFTHRDTLWASRQGHTHLIDGPRLRLWAQGTPLDQVLGPEGPT